MIDLHTHSTVSDGSDPPEAIPELAAAAGCTAVALTDHDRMDGVERARTRATEMGIGFISGCEVSCEWSPGTCHVLVYFAEPGGNVLDEELRRLQDDRARRNETLIERLNGMGIDITLDEVVREAGGGSVGRPHIAAVLVAKQVVSSPQEAFDTILGKGRPGYVSKARVRAAEVAGWAGLSGGVAVLAHPLSLGLDPAGTEAAVAELAAAGIAGMECHYGRYRPDEREGLVALARRHGMVATGGSDHHGSYKPDLHVGTGTGDLEVPDTVLADLEARRP